MSQPNDRRHPAQINAMPGPDDTTRLTLDNGLTVLVRENHAAPVTVIDGFLRGGSVLDPTDKTGLAGFVTGMLTRGSEQYDFDAFNEAVEGVGASLAIGADDHTISFGATSLSEDYPAMLGILADCLRRPTFPTAHIQRLRSQKRIRIQERDNDTQESAGLRFFETLYQNHPYGRSTLGYAETLGNITRDDLVEFHIRTFTPQDATIVIVGDVDTDQAIKHIVQHFGDWQGPAPDLSLPPIPPLDSARTATVQLPGKVQADIMIGFPAVPRHHADYFPIRLANTVLGRFGMMGRLGEVVREELGLAYYVYSSHEAGPHIGVWYAAAGVNAQNTDVAIRAIQTEFARLCDETVSPEELNDSQAYMTGILPLQLETNEGVASTLSGIERHRLGLDYLQQYNDLVYSVTPAAVQRVAQTYLRADTYVLTVAGPAETGSEPPSSE